MMGDEPRYKVAGQKIKKFLFTHEAAIRCLDTNRVVKQPGSPALKNLFRRSTK